MEIGSYLVNDGGYRMSVMDHVETLKAKHADLDHTILEEENRPCPDETRIKELKRQKLRIKDELRPLRHQ